MQSLNFSVIFHLGIRRQKSVVKLFLVILICLSIHISGFQRYHVGNIQIARNTFMPQQIRHPHNSALSRLPSTSRSQFNRRKFPLIKINLPSDKSSEDDTVGVERGQRRRFLWGALRQFVAWPKQQYNNLANFFTSQVPMLRYLWPRDNPSLQLYLVASMVFMYLGNWFSLKVPFILQGAIDSIAATGFNNLKTGGVNTALLGLADPIRTAFILYGCARTAAVVCSEIKASLFAHVSQNVLKKFAYQIFCHLHALDSAFHLTTPSGVISVAYVRAVRGFQTMLLEIVFSIAPAILDLAMVSSVLYHRFGSRFSSITLLTFTFYLLYTIWMTQFRVKLRQELVEVDNKRNGFLIDSILNHEVVKLFTNEKREIQRFDSYLQRISKLSIDCTYLIALLNIGQAVLFSSGLVLSLLFALKQVTSGKMSVGDLVAVNAMLLQLAVPFNNMGYTCKPLYLRHTNTNTNPLISS